MNMTEFTAKMSFKCDYNGIQYEKEAVDKALHSVNDPLPLICILPDETSKIIGHVDRQKISVEKRGENEECFLNVSGMIYSCVPEVQIKAAHKDDEGKTIIDEFSFVSFEMQ